MSSSKYCFATLLRAQMKTRTRPRMIGAPRTQPRRHQQECYLALDAEELREVKRGRTTLVLVKDLESWLEKLPAKF
jgi:hypothetical protein